MASSASVSEVMPPDAAGEWPIPDEYDLVETTKRLRVGPRDPTFWHEPDGFWRTTHTVDGAASVRLIVRDTVRAEAWGDGAAAAIREVPGWIGLNEPVWTLAPHPVVDRLARRHRGLRGTDIRNVFEALTVTVLQQLVTWQEAAVSWRRMCFSLGEAAPGPGRLQLPPTPRAIRAAGPWRLHALGVGMGQARTLMDVAFSAHAIQRAADMPTSEAATLLEHVRGVGRWTSSIALGARLGRPEPVPVGDFHLPHTIAWALAGEPRGTDERMAELLSPFAGQAFRVIRLVLAEGIEAPKRGPRQPFRLSAR